MIELEKGEWYLKILKGVLLHGNTVHSGYRGHIYNRPSYKIPSVHRTTG